MLLTTMRHSARALRREPAYAAIAIVTLAIGIASAILILGLVRYCWQYNAEVPDVEHVYVVKQRDNVDPTGPWYDQAPLLLRSVAAAAPGVAAATGYLPSRPETAGLTVNVDGKLHALKSLTVLPGFVEMLGLRAVRGDLATALGAPDQIAVTELTAMRLFGTKQALGRSLFAEGKLLRVGAVLRTPAANTTMPFEALLGTDSTLAADVRDEMRTGLKGWPGKLLVRVKTGASVPMLVRQLQDAVDGAPALHQQAPDVKARLGRRPVMDIALARLDAAYFDTGIKGNFIAGAGQRGDPVVVAGLAAVAVLILVLASINFVNLATVRVVRRQRELAMRKVLGASGWSIALELLAEAWLITFLAASVGLLLAWLALPLFSTLVDRQLNDAFTVGDLGWVGTLVVGLGLLTAAWPAWIAWSVPSAKSLAGRTATESRATARLRRGMTVAQLTAAIGFASVTLAIAWQTSYAMRASPGFDPASILIVDMPEQVKYSAPARGLMTALAAAHGVQDVAVSDDAIGRHNDMWRRDLKRPDGTSATMEIKQVSRNFFMLYAIKPEAGRLFDQILDRDDDPVPLVLNALAARQLGFADARAALGQIVITTSFDNKPVPGRVIGIAPPLRFQSLREAPAPMAFQLSTGGSALSVRTDGDPAKVVNVIRSLWPSYFPSAIASIQPASSVLAANYADDARMASLLALATGLALTLAAFGSYVLSADTVQRRAREIVLRKLHGAGDVAIGLLVLRGVGTMLLVAASIGLPVAAVAIARYLSTWVETAPAGYLTLLLAFVVTSVVALAAASRQAWIAMKVRPANALRM
ncbi:cell division protein FtsX [Janthinobacterium sp. BJB1]|nr:cell division protein FtsX [Janthinobacterium sp. BJB1]